ncbi:MAG: cation diffusion facilitator family transporter [Syntrophobacteraceae bacterium]|jgi:cation diffusion facilitator family transporter|nr:cation diffusion facilitator family transporter [Syntrophobacteraceae bacterium]
MTGGASESELARVRILAVFCSLVVGTALMGLKFYNYSLTGSAAILSDALESIINVVASGFALVSVIMVSRPPDPCHPYGHGKIEYFSAGFEGALIVIAALGIVHQGYHQITTPHELPNLNSGLWLLLVTGVVNLALGLVLLQVGRRSRSLTLVADGKHVLTDVWSTAGVLGGLLLVQRTHLYWLDGATACLMAVIILVTGARLIRHSYAGLMDAADPEILNEISRLVNEHRKENWIDIHRLRAWRAGNRLFLDFHLILPRDLSLEHAHAEVMGLRRILETRLPGMVEAMIHAEPCTEPECPICGFDPCKLRTRPFQQLSPWVLERLTSYFKSSP